MFDVDLPNTETIPPIVRSFAACLASVIETSPSEVPQPPADLQGTLAHWRSWLAGRGAGLVPIANPARFNWPGYWLAILDGKVGKRHERDGIAVLMFGTPSGVVLSPQDGDLVGAAASTLPVREGYVISGLDPSVPVPSAASSARLSGTVEAIAVTAEATEPMRLVSQALACAGRGLDGDRYAAKAGTFTPADDTVRGYDLTLVEAEVLDELRLSDGGTLGYAEARRNIVTRGLELNALVGRRFRVGKVECLGQRLCEPCAHLEHLTSAGALRGLIHRGGLRADVLTDGKITTDSDIETID